MRNVLFLLIITTVISGCASGTINSNLKQKDGSDSVIVFKVNPTEKIVFFFKGKEEQGVFKQNVFSKAAFRGKPKNGYVVFKAKPGDTIALTQYAHKAFGFKNSAWPCQDFETVSFSVPANEVLYMTDMTLGEKGEGFNLTLAQNLEQARVHLQRYYPSLATDLKQGEFKMVPGDRACAENVAYPVAEDKSSTETVPAVATNPTAQVAPAAVEKPAAQVLPSVADKSNAHKHEITVQNYINAFSAQDVDAMLEMVTDDVQWLTIDGETITKQTNSKQELRKAMVDYFSSCSTCRSRLANAFSTNSKVSAVEIVSYQTRNGLKEDKSVSLYEFSGSLIKRVYYFPVEK